MNISHLVIPFVSDLRECQQKNEEKLQHIRLEYSKLDDLPRKLKKKRKKKLILDYQIFSFAEDMFSEYGF